MIRRRLALLVVVVLVGFVSASPLAAVPPSAEWARSATAGSGESEFAAVTVDPDGDVYAAGVIRSSGTGFLEFGNGVKVSNPVPDRYNLLIARYDDSGDAQWAKSVTGSPTDSCFYKLALDSERNVYAVGYIGQGTYDFGDGVSAEGIHYYWPGGYMGRVGNCILVKYSASGKALWARTTVACTGWSAFYSVAVDASGNMYCAGKIGPGVFDFGNNVSIDTGPDTDGSVILMKYDSAGVAQWARSVRTGTGEKWAIAFSALALDPSGNPHVVGSIGTQTFDFGNGVAAKGTFGYSALIVKYDPQGMARWACTSTVGTEGYQNIAIDASGNLYAVGWLQSNMTVQFGNSVTVRATNTRRGNMLLVKYDPAGTALWARSVQDATAGSGVSGIAIDRSGGIVLAGSISGDGGGTVNWGNGVTAKGPWSGTAVTDYDNALLVMYDSDGKVQWAQTLTAGASKFSFNDICFDEEGHLYAVGHIGDGAFAFGAAATVKGVGSTAYNSLLVKY